MQESSDSNAPVYDPLGLAISENVVPSAFDLNDFPDTVAVDKPKRFVFELDETFSDGSVNLNFIIDNSTLEVFDTCPRKAKFVTIDSRGFPANAALNLGTVTHLCLEHLYTASNFSALGTLARPFDDYATIITNFFNDHPVSDTEYRNLNTAISTIQAYIQTYKHEHNSFEIIKVEHPFRYYLGSVTFDNILPYSIEQLTGKTHPIDFPVINKIHIFWTGKIDVIARDQNGIFIMDHKTTSMLGETFFSDFQLSSQMLGYIWAVNQYLYSTRSPERTSRLVLNAIANRKPSRTGKSLELIRQTFTYSSFHQEEWVIDTLHKCNDYLAHLNRNYFPKATKWCMGKYGACPYHCICTKPSSEEQAQHLASPLFSNIFWTPFYKE